ncbi:MAG: hypothetical protein ACLS8R_03660 [Anaeromassilibacillus sp.]
MIDPFCGSGTILVESALCGKTSPRAATFVYRGSAGRISVRGLAARTGACADLVRRDASFAGYGYDIDGAAVNLTLENARKAGVISCIHAEKRDVADFQPLGERGDVICNPPYGERLLDIRAAEELYRTMGKVFTPKKKWSYNIISPDETFEECYGRKADRRRKLYNGMIKCQFYMYYKSGI